MATKLKTSEKTEKILRKLKYETDLTFNSLARIAIALSLRNGLSVEKSTNTRGKEFNRYSLMGDEEDLYKAILQINGQKQLTDDKFFSNESVIKNHIDYGSLLLEKLYKETNQDVDEFLAKLSSFIPQGNKQLSVGEVLPLDIKVGKDIKSKEPVIYEFNNTKRHNNPHMGIMGTTGAGKTQFLLNTLYDIREQSKFQTNFIFFDYKGEFLNKGGKFQSNVKEKFVEDTQAEILQVPSDPIPINPFTLNDYSKKAIAMSAEEKADTFAAIGGHFGSVQKGNLVRAIKKAYQRRRNEELPYPDLNEVYQIIQEIYEKENKNPDTLIETIRRLSDFGLFWEHGSEIEIIRNLNNKTLIIDLNHLNVLKELVVFLIIEQLYRELSAIGEIQTKNGYRQLRTILVIDEAHHYLPHKNKFLQLILREGRSKGIGVFLASQSPSDYDQQFFDFKELLEFPVMFKSRGLKKRSFQNLLGCSSKSTKELIQIVPQLKPFQAIGQALDAEHDYQYFETEAFYKNVK